MSRKDILWHFSILPPDIPASGQLHEVMTISYTVHNRTTLVQELEAKMNQSDAFMYSGNRLVSNAWNVRTLIFWIHNPSQS